MGKTVNGAVSSPRGYDASGRRERAGRNRDRILDAARVLFLAGGYGATTVVAIAAEAGVSAETLYKKFGGKPGLVRAIYERSLLGSGASPAEQRSDAVQEEEPDPRVLVLRLGALVAEVAPEAGPVQGLIRDAAAAGDKDMALLLDEVESSRYRRMLHNAATLLARGILAPGLTAEKAADVMWAYTAPELYENLVLKRGWTPQDLGVFVGSALAAALLA
ncbi:TetR/AcrR family transcriptional regulator [Pseudarthrobacter sp. N5]|uniref:TetR/AcrR family transcriptional regulator n=1 Tax=Pseudarthrobacter sp. N5 TaxID=3418416 RepID=UPI003CF7DB6F